MVNAHAHGLRAQFGKLVDIIPKFACLLGAARRIVLDVEVQYQPLAAIIRKFMRLPILIVKAEVWRGLPNLGPCRMRALIHEEQYRRPS